MFERTFTVKFLSLKKCFCYISDKQTRAIDQGSYVKVTYDRNVFYFTVGGFLGNLKENEVGINGVYAKALGLKEKDLILFSLCNKPIPGTKTLNIIPNNKDDYEILELMAENVQSTLLDQLRVVNNNQKIVIWISNSIHTIVNVDGVTPWSPGRLDHLTEVVIKPPVAKRAKTPPKEEATSRASPWTANGLLKRFAREERAAPDRYEGICVPFVFRLHPSDDVADNNGDVFTVYARKGSLPFYARRAADLFFYLKPIAPPKDFKYPDDGEELKEIGVKLVLLDGDEEKGWDCCKPLFVDEAIFNHYGLSKGSKVVLRSVKKFGDVEKIEINAEKKHVREIREKFKLFVGDNATNNRKIVLNSDFVMKISDAHRVVLKFAPIGVTCCLLDGDFIRNGNLSINEIELPNIPQNNTNKNDRDIYTNLANFNQILNDCRKCLELGYEDVANLENILIVGKPGSGKSTIAQEFANRVSQSPIHFYVETISCKSIKGKAADSLQKYFETKFSKLVYYQPSVLILDDLNVICEKVQDGEEPTQQNLLFNRASEITANFLDDILKNHFVQVIATSESTLKLNKRVFDSRGVHFFKNIFAINELSKSDRMGLLKFTFEKETKLDDDVDLENLSLKTEGYVAQDLTDLVHRCVFEALKEDLNTVKSEHCERALGASSSLSLRNVQLHAPGEKDFSDIGGLDDVKKVLVESMLWPAKYANIFANAPLRLQSGLLLYGPPGTGKTILAGAAAKQCNLRLISIKGPELLSKYIGASEQAVRDVFEKAQSAKPCILFFDEFDSLAPRRGHDNTGVTDRVVNQFLTQLDGVESLTGVCVLAATSRPDLLDPALLRPGRLDRQILCPLPDPVSRLAIVRSLAKGLRLADDVDLEEIARRTEGFSGADLQAVLYTAQLSSVEYLLDEEAREDVDVETEITRGHLEEALRTTRPSLTTEDRRKYDRIYAKFQANEDLLDLQAGKQRTTLA